MLVIVLVGILGCGRTDLVVYSDRYSTLPQSVIDEFTRETGIDIHYTPFESQSAQNTLYKKLHKGRNPVDIILLSDYMQMETYATQGMLTEIQNDTTLSAVYDNFKSDTNMWVGISAAGKIIVSNKTSSITPPQSYADLLTTTDAQVLISSPMSNTGVIPFVAYMMAQHGVGYTNTWIENITNSMPRLPYGKDEIQVRDIDGELANIAIVDTNAISSLLYAFDEQDRVMIERTKIYPPNPMFFYPNRVVGIIAGTKFTEESQQFVSFLLTQDIQKELSEEFFDYPVTTHRVLNILLASWGRVTHKSPSTTIPYQSFYEDAKSLLVEYQWIDALDE